MRMRANRSLSELSTGMSQRMTLQCALQNNPTYLTQQQAFVDSTLAASTATYNLVIVGSLALSLLLRKGISV